MTLAFSLGLTGARAGRSVTAPRCSRRGRGPRMDLSVGSVLSEGAAVLAIAAGVTYFLRAVPEPEESPNDVESVESMAKTSVPEPYVPVQSEPNEGILGLMGNSRSEPRAASFRRTDTKPKSEPVLNSIPIALDQESRRKEELSWGFATLCDLGPVSTILIDADGRVLRSEGSLLQADAEMTGVIERVSQTQKMEVLDVANNKEFPYLEGTVRSVACYPVGESGAVLVVASEERGFFGVMELRVTGAVVSRLGAFLDAVTGVDAR